MIAQRPVRNSEKGVWYVEASTMKGERSYTQNTPGSTLWRTPFTTAGRKEVVTEYCTAAHTEDEVWRRCMQQDS